MVDSIVGSRKKLQIHKLQNQLKAVSSSYLLIFSSACLNFDPDPLKVTTVVSSDLDSDTSQLKNMMWFITLLSYDLDPDIPTTTPQKTVISDDLVPDSFTTFTSFYQYCEAIKL